MTSHMEKIDTTVINTAFKQASFNIMRYKGRDSASGIGRKLSIIRPGATTLSVGSMATKGQMNPTSRVNITASQPGENRKSNCSEHTIVSSILTDLIFKEATEEEQYRRTHHWTSEAAEFERRVSKVLIDTNITVNSNINLDLRFW